MTKLFAVTLLPHETTVERTTLKGERAARQHGTQWARICVAADDEQSARNAVLTMRHKGHFVERSGVAVRHP